VNVLEENVASIFGAEIHSSFYTIQRQHVDIKFGTNLQRYTASGPEEYDLNKRTK
jgi:hypothetical protein